MKTFLSIFICTLLLSQSVFAKECLDTAETTTEMASCTCNDFKKADKELNNVYKKLLQAYNNNKKSIAVIKDAQRVWMVYRDKHIESFYPAEATGTMLSVCRCSALTKLTQERTYYLKLLLNGYGEGDTCNPQPGS